MARLRLQGIEKSYGKVRAVCGIDLDIADGEVLVGPSGCGKSTLLRCIAGLEEVDAGTVTIGDDVVNDVRPRDRNLAMVFQNYALYPYMNVRENIAFGLKARRMPKAEIETRVQRAADMLGIEALLDRLPRQLSGGQRQRVAIGRAIVRDARLFLFDEPLSNLDAQLRDEMRTEIKRLHQELGKTMIYVTHDQIEAMTLADRIVLLRDGAIEQEGGPLDLFERPVSKFVARFLGSPPINFIPARLDRDESGLAVRCGEGAVFALPRDRTDALESRVGSDLILGLRPEHITGASHAGGHRENLAPHKVTIDLVQPTGTRLYGAFALAGTEVLAELQAHDVERPGETIEVTLDMQRAILIDPVQPIMNIRALAHEVAPGLKVTCTMLGDTFEMEDQRNWTDASYKTYVRPLGLPHPFVLKAGESIEQAVELQFEGAASAQADGARGATPEITVAVSAEAGRVPQIAMGLEWQSTHATMAHAEQLAGLDPAYLSCYFDARHADSEAMRGFSAVAQALGRHLALEAVLPDLDNPGEALRSIAEMASAAGARFGSVAVSPAEDLGFVIPGTVFDDMSPYETLYAAAREAFPGSAIGGGSFMYFTELNRKPPPFDGLDFVIHSTCAIVHAADDRSVTETVETLPYIIRSGRSLFGGKPYVSVRSESGPAPVPSAAGRPPTRTAPGLPCAETIRASAACSAPPGTWASPRVRPTGA